MIKTAIIIFLLLPVAVMAQKLTLTGNISGLADSAHVVLLDLENNNAELAKTHPKAGKFVLGAKLEAPSILGLTVGDNIKTAVFLGNENVTVNGSVNENPDNWQFTGSAVQNDFTAFQKIFIPKFEKLNQLAQQAQAGVTTDSLRSAMDVSIGDIQQSVDDFIAKKPASPVSAMAVLSTIGFTKDVALLEKRVHALAPAALSTAIGGQLKQAVVEAAFNSIGSTAMNFTQADTLGKNISLADFRGKYVLVDFWASWCGPCRRENPNVVATYNKYKDKNFTVLGVSLDEERDSWLRAIKKDSLSWTQVSDLKGWENAVAQQYHITAIPRNLLIGPDGKILAKDLRGEDLQMKLRELLGE